MLEKSEPLYKVVATAGKFDQIFDYDIEFLKYARDMGDELVVLLYNDFRVEMSRGSPPCMLGKKFQARLEVLEALDCVDVVVPTHHGEDFRYGPDKNAPDRDDLSVGYELKQLRPHLFVSHSPKAMGQNEQACIDLNIDYELVLMEDYYAGSVQV